MAETYPRPGTMAHRVHEYIMKNPGTTVNGIKRALELNSSPLRDCLRALMRRNLITDAPDERNHHHYTARNARL